MQVSESIAEHLDRAATDVLGTSVGNVIGDQASLLVRQRSRDGILPALFEIRVDAAEGARVFDAMLHKSGDVLVLELEPQVSAPSADMRRLNRALHSTVRRLERATSVVTVAQGMAEEIYELTGFDRVWVYRFHPDWHGEIIGEAKRADIETWLGMHYPASDIPRQARELFLRNWLRVISDLGFTPSPIVPELTPGAGAPLDLGGSLLRSVSRVHVQYLTNMGVTASLVISLIYRGKLWGLISGHHYSGAKRISVEDRTICEFLASAFSLQIGSFELLENQDYALQARMRERRLIEQLVNHEDSARIFADANMELANVLNASGAMFIRGDDAIRAGRLPSTDQVTTLISWLRTRDDDIFVTSSLAAIYPPAAEFSEVASGLLAVPLMRDRKDYLLWFREEQRQKVRWAGDPRKPVTILPDGSTRLHPRGSFELWEEEARGSSVPWKAIDQEVALDIRRSLLDLRFRWAEKITALNEELLLSNTQLEESATELEIQTQELIEQREQSDLANRAKADFLAVVSHELRTPLNAIGGYAQLMSLGLRGSLTDEQRADLARIAFNQRHLLGLINSILNFTKLEAGQIELERKRVEIGKLIADLQTLIGPQMEAKTLDFQVDVCNQRIAALGDEEKLRQILVNLITNSMKFTAAGGHVRIGCQEDSTSVSISISDTGRGIAPHALTSIFEPFVQVDRHITAAHEQGLGLGLAISRQLALQMGGDLSVRSAPGEGSTFTLTVPRAS